MRLLPNRSLTLSFPLITALALTACASDDGVAKPKSSKVASSASTDRSGDGSTDGTAESASAGAAASDPLNGLLDGLVAQFGETVKTDVPHSVERGKFEVIARYVADQPIFHLTLPVDPSKVGRPLPVVVWANGGCLRSDFLWQNGMFDVWASQGYAILALTGTAGSDDILGMVGFTTSIEQRALIDWVEEQNESGPYEGIFDLDRVVFAGNSCGGITALEAASLDERGKAVFVLSGSSGMGSANAMVIDNIKVPVAYAVGGPEDVAGANATFDFEAMKEGVPVMIAHRFEGDHITVSSDRMIVPDVGKIGLSFMNLALYGSQDGYDELMSETVCEGCADDHWTLESKNLDTLLKQ